MFLIIISLVTGYIGMFVGSTHGLENTLGIIGFFSPSMYLLQKIYVKLHELDGE